MSATWTSENTPEPTPITPKGWLRVAWRAAVLALGMVLGLVLLLSLRLVEWAIHRAARPWTPYIVQTYCRFALKVLGMGHQVIGTPMRPPGATVANHASWFDIIAINAAMRVTFVSKAEVAGWPGIGAIAKATGTRFISRNPREAGAQRDLMAATLAAGHMPLFFPEGTSTDGVRVLPFRSSLFAAIFDNHVKNVLQVQSVSVIYHAPDGRDPRFYGWWGDMDFGAHALKLLAQAPHGGVTIVCHPVLRASDFADRKSLAKATETQVRAGFEAHSGGDN